MAIPLFSWALAAERRKPAFDFRQVHASMSQVPNRTNRTSAFDDLMRQAWPVLWEAIRQGRTVSYTELAGRGGRPLHHRQLARQLLREMSLRCKKAGLPDLAALVVRRDTGKPGSGWWDLNPGRIRGPEDPEESWEEAMVACLNHPWKSTDVDLLTSDGKKPAKTRPKS